MEHCRLPDHLGSAFPVLPGVVTALTLVVVACVCVTGA